VQKPGDYAAFEQVLAEASERHPTRILALCLMPNHRHFVLWLRADGELSAFMRWLTHTHTMRWHAHYHSVGTVHLYQGRFRAFPTQADGHFLTVCRYVERNALRAKLVKRAEDWRWGNLWRRRRGSAEQQIMVQIVNRPQTEAEVDAVRRAVLRGSPFGTEAWTKRTAARMGLEHTLRTRQAAKDRRAASIEARLNWQNRGRRPARTTRAPARSAGECAGGVRAAPRSAPRSVRPVGNPRCSGPGRTTARPSARHP
jgi:putative transposase